MIRIRSLRRVTEVALVAGAALSSARGADAASGSEHAAKAAFRKGLGEYGVGDYAAARAHFSTALASCGDDACDPKTKATILRELGSAQFEDGDGDAAKKSYADARSLSPDLAFNHDDDTKLASIWNAAKGGASESDESSKPTSADDDQEAASSDSTPEAPKKEEPSIASDAPLPYARIWVGVAGTVDVDFLPSGSDLCQLARNDVPENSQGIYCTDPYGKDFPARGTKQNAALIPGNSGSLVGGAKAGDIRALVAIDYALTPVVLVGVRVGYVANGYPGSAAASDGHAFGTNLHAEIRGTYLFGHDALSRPGFAPLVFVGGGIAKFDARDTSYVALQGIRGTQPVNVWVTTGPGFVSAGGGARYQFSPRIAFTGAARLNLAFGPGNALVSVGPEVAVQYGF